MATAQKSTEEGWRAAYRARWAERRDVLQAECAQLSRRMAARRRRHAEDKERLHQLRWDHHVATLEALVGVKGGVKVVTDGQDKLAQFRGRKATLIRVRRVWASVDFAGQRLAVRLIALRPAATVK